MSAPAKRCLLIAPLTFYSFHTTISRGLEARGYAVDLLNEEYPANNVGKVLGKLALPLLRRLTLRALRRWLEERPPYDLVIIIKGRGLGPESLALLRNHATRVVGYNFDSFRYNPSPGDWHRLTDRYATFDIDDAAEFQLPLVHLFSAAIDVSTGKRWDLSVIQRVHSDRLHYVDRLARALPPGAKAYIFLYENSWLTFALSLLRRPLLYRRLWKYISFRPLPYDQAMAVLGGSRVTFDYAHPHQSGITVRCFEAQSLGTAVLTNNSSVERSGRFPAGTVATMPPQADSDTLRSLVAELVARPIPPEERRHRTLDDFLDELLAP